MSSVIFDGRTFASGIKEDLKKEVLSIKNTFKVSPTLLSIQVGSDPGSSIYVKSQAKVAEEVGVSYILKNFDVNIKEEELIKFIKSANDDTNINGIIIQMPLPKGLDAKKIICGISPEKDAEGIHPENLGKVLLGDTTLAPCTAKACMEILKSTGENLYGKETVVIGHSDIVGKPITLMLLNKFATVTCCHIATFERKMLEEHVSKAEILIVAAGKAGIIKGSWVKQNCIVLDVGINRVEGKIIGDVEFEEASKRAKFITPVPGGVGSVTVTILMKNVINAFNAQRKEGIK